MNNLHSASIALALLAASTLAGCAQTTSNFDRGFGNATRAAVAAQTLYPGAVRNADPAGGIDGHAALAAQQQYRASFGAAAATAAPLVPVNAK